MDGNRCYAILLAEYDGQMRDCSSLYAVTGEMKDDAYLAFQQQRCQRKAQGLAQGKDPEAEAVLQLAEQIQQRRNALKGEKTDERKTNL